MKKEFKSSALMVIIFTVMLGSVNASNLIPFNKELKKTTLTLNNVKKGQKLLIKDSNGLILYKELIKDSGAYYKGFDLTSLPNGNYYFELNKDVEIKIIPFNVTSNNVVFNKEKEVSIFKPIVSAKDNKVFVSKLSLGLKPLEVKIFQESSSNSDYLLFSETIENTKIIERIYSLPKTEKVRYRLVFTTEGREFVEYINI